MTLRNLLAAACLLLPLMASAHNIEKGQRVPPVGIADRGELILDNDKFSYKAWNSAQLAGKVRVVQHIAGRTSAKEKNAGEWSVPLCDLLRFQLRHISVSTMKFQNLLGMALHRFLGPCLFLFHREDRTST